MVQLRLGSPDTDAQFPGCFLMRVTFHFCEQEYRAIAIGQRKNHFFKVFTAQRIGNQDCSFAPHFIQFSKFEPPVFIKLAQGSANHNSFYPGSERRFKPVLPHVAEYLDECILQYILGIIAVTHNTVGRRKHRIAIAVI